MAKQKVISAAIWISLVTALSKILGLARESFLAAYFGASSASDAFKVAYSLPDVFFFILSAAIAQTFIPVYNDILKEQDVIKTRRFLNNVYTIVIIISVGLVVLGLLFIPNIVRFIAPGFNNETLKITIGLSVIIMPAALFQILANISSSFLQSHNRFMAPSLVWYPHNIAIIASIIFFHRYGIKVAAYGTVIGIIGMLLIQIPSMIKEGFRYRPIIDLKDDGLKKMCILIIPVVISSAFNQLYIIINRMIASGLSQGTISALDYASKITTLTYNIFILSIATVIYPALSRLSEEHDGFTLELGKALRIGTFITIPMTAILIVLRIPIVEVLYQHGNFTSEDTYVTSIALLGLAVGMCGIAFRELLNRAFYALKDTKTPMINGIIAIIMNITFCIIFSRYYGIVGIALGSSIAAIISGGMLLFRLRNKIGNVRGVWIANGFIKSIIAAIIMGICILCIELWAVPFFNLSGSTINNILNLLIAGVVGSSVYVGMLFIMNVEEVNHGIYLFKGKLNIIKGKIFR